MRGLQEKHHYVRGHKNNVYQSLEEVQNRDRIKRRLVEERGITLLVIPYWWDGKEERCFSFSFVIIVPCNCPCSLVATIKKRRPDLLPERAVDSSMATPEQIPEVLPENISAGTPDIEGIGEPVTACFFSLSTVDPTNWYCLLPFFFKRSC